MTQTVGRYMTPNPQTISPETPVPEAAQRMRQGGFRRLPVLDGGQLVGIVTDRDLKEAMPSGATSLSIWELNYLIGRLEVREVMRSPVLTVEEKDPLEVAARRMLEHRVGGLVVVANGNLRGIITVTDVLRAFVGLAQIQQTANK